MIEIEIIENTAVAREAFDRGYGSSTFIITAEHIEALKAGKILAIGGETTEFYVMAHEPVANCDCETCLANFMNDFEESRVN